MRRGLRDEGGGGGGGGDAVVRGGVIDRWARQRERIYGRARRVAARRVRLGRLGEEGSVRRGVLQFFAFAGCSYRYG